MCEEGERTYGLNLEFLKPPCSCSCSVSSSSSSSPSSTISESSNSAITVSTRKRRTPRKRPNQIYNEAAALLSTAYPNLFSSKSIKTQPSNIFFNQRSSSEVLLPFRGLDSSSSFLLNQCKPKVVVLEEKLDRSQGEINSASVMNNSIEVEGYCGEDFDAESILDEEIGEGIDSIIGSVNENDTDGAISCKMIPAINFGGKMDLRLGLKSALRHVDNGGSWWNLPCVEISKISPKIVYNSPQPTAAAAEKKKKRPVVEGKNPETVAVKENTVVKSGTSLMLKLNYNEVKKAWSGKGSPFADDRPFSGVSGNDVTAWLSEIDLLGEKGRVREASVMRYKQKRYMRFFSNNIRYQVTKHNPVHS